MFKKIHKRLRKNRVRNANFFVEPYEIFLDSKNLEQFDTQQFEGRIEKQIPKKTILFLSLFFLLIAFGFIGKLFYLQISKGESYLKRSENNTLDKQLIFADRGIIYDRNKVELVWNKKDTEGKDFSNRIYKSPGFSHLLGYVSYPRQDNAGNYWQGEFIGKDGLEKEYSEKLQGKNGSKIIETDASKKIHSENTINIPIRGADLVTTIDAKIQEELYLSIKNLAESSSYIGGGGVIMDINTGEILASTSFPEYNSEILSIGKNKEIINEYINSKKKYFMDRTLSGLYTPGSIVKPFFALGALNEGIIDPYKKILSTGSISIQNPYDKTKKTIFKDWKAHGWTNMAEAIAVSSDVYFYSIGGGYEGQKGLGILNLEKYARLFGIGEKTDIDLPDEKGGTIPSPEWKAKNFKNDPWRIGDTYNTSIGQYGFQVTPLEMTRAAAALANNGVIVSPHFLLGDTEKENNKKNLNINKSYFDIVNQGMRLSVTNGTAIALNVPYVNIAAKTGTAQVGVKKDKVNSWVMGFFPYEKPKYAFVVMMESGPTKNATGASAVMRQLFDWMSINTPEYFK